MCVEDEPGVANAYAPLTVVVIRLSFTPYAWVEMMEAGLDIWCPTSINGPRNSYGVLPQAQTNFLLNLLEYFIDGISTYR